jgi:polysaccharide biosynthesis transport protein
VGLREYLAVLRRRWLTVLITVGVFIGLAGVISAAREPVYETSIDLFVLARNADDSVDYNANLLAEDRTQTYARLVETRRVAEAVVEDLDLSDDPSDISGRINAQAREDSVIVLVTVRDASPQRAQAIADSVGRVLPPLMREVERADERDGLSIQIEPLGAAPLPTSPATPSSRTLVLIGGMVGLVAGLVLALVRHAFDPRVRCLDDLAHVPAPVIGIVGAIRGSGRWNKQPAADDRRYRLVRLSLERLGADTRSMLITTTRRERVATARVVQSLARAFTDAGRRAEVLDGGRLSPTGAPSSLAELPGDADVVLVDGPPLLTSVDGILIAAKVSSVLLCVECGRSRKADVQQAAELLISLGVPLWLLLIERRHGRHPSRSAPQPEAIDPSELQVEQTVP